MHLRKLKIMTAGASLFNIVAHCQISFILKNVKHSFLRFKRISAFGLFFFFTIPKGTSHW